MDITLFFATMYIMLADMLGLMTLGRRALAAARERGAETLENARDWLGTKVSKPLAVLLWVCALLLLVSLALGTWVHYSDWFTDEERAGGIYATFFIVTLLSVAGLIVWGIFQYIWGNERYRLGPDGEPLRVSVARPDPNGEFVIHQPGDDPLQPYEESRVINGETYRMRRPATDGTRERFMLAADIPLRERSYRPRRVLLSLSAIFLTVAFAAVSLTLSYHALGVESRALWLQSMIIRYAGLLVLAIGLLVLAWIVRKGVGAFERVLQAVIEPLASLLPGLTFQNVAARLFPGGLNLVEEERLAVRIALAATTLWVTMIPFDVVVFLCPTKLTAIIVGAVYLLGILVSLAATFVSESLKERVEKRRERLYEILTRWYWIVGAFVLSLSLGVLLSHPITKGIRDRLTLASEQVNRVQQGQEAWLNHASFWSYLALGAIAALVVYLARKSEDDLPLWRRIVFAVSGLALAYAVLGIVINSLGFFGGGKKGAKLEEVQAKTKTESATLAQPVTWQWVNEKELEFKWATKEPTDCKLRIERVDGGKHETYREGKLVQAVYDAVKPEKGKLPKGDYSHEARLVNLAPGMVIVYSVVCELTTGEYAGRFTEMTRGNQTTTHPSLVKPVTIPAPTTTPTAAPTTRLAAPPSRTQNADSLEQRATKVQQELDQIVAGW